MIKDKNEFYETLWNDYYDIHSADKENSFIYGYLKKKKDTRAEIIGRSKAAVTEYSNQKKRDKYTLLKSAYLAVVRYGVMTVQEYSDILKDIMGAKLPAKYENIGSSEEMEKAEEMFERRFLMGCVGDMFYNLGYRTNKNIEHSQSVKLPAKASRDDGYNDELEMLYEFSRYRGADEKYEVLVSVNEMNDEHIERCSRLYDTLIKEKRTNAFVPLLVDSNTSAGVYIIGVDRFGDETFGYIARKPTDICYACIIYFYDVEAISRLENLPEDEISLSMWVKERHNSVRKAFESFGKLTSGQDFYENYPYANDDTLPDGIDDSFNLYFITKEQNEEYMRKKMTAMIVEAVLEKETKTIRRMEEQEALRKKPTGK